ncbi:hypothetical protein BD626DRAFT_501845, partial [Schizophyllum amplum]
TTYGPSQRNQPTSLKERIAALNAGTGQSRAVSPTPGNPSSQQGSLKAKVAQFEQKGSVPAPRSAFGVAAPPSAAPLEPQITGKSVGLGPPPRGTKGTRSVSAPFASEPEVPKPPSTLPPPPPDTPPKLAKDLRQRSTSFAAALDRARHAEHKAKQREARDRARITPMNTGSSQGIAAQHTGGSAAMLTPMHTGGSAISWLVPMHTGNSTGGMLSPHVTGGSSFSHPDSAISENGEDAPQLPVKPPLVIEEELPEQQEASLPASDVSPASLPALTPLSTAGMPIPQSASPIDDSSTPTVPTPPHTLPDTPPDHTPRDDDEQQTQYIQVPPRHKADVPYTPDSSFETDEDPSDLPRTPTRAEYTSRSRPLSMLELDSSSMMGSPGVVSTAQRASASQPITIQPPTHMRSASQDTPTTPTHRVGRSVTLSHTPNFRAPTGERGFRAVVHARVREQQKPRLPATTPRKAPAPTTIVSEEVPTTPGLGDLAALLGQAAMLEEQLSAGMLPDEAPERESQPSTKDDGGLTSGAEPSESEAEPDPNMVLPVGASIGGRTKRKRTFKNPLTKVGVRRSRTTGGSVSSMATEEPMPPMPTHAPALAAPETTAASSSDTLQPPPAPPSAPPTLPPKAPLLGRAKSSASSGSTPPSSMPTMETDGRRQRFPSLRSLSSRSASAMSAIRHSVYMSSASTSDDSVAVMTPMDRSVESVAMDNDTGIVSWPRKSTGGAPSVKSHGGGSVRKRFTDKIWPAGRNRVKSNASRAGDSSLVVTEDAIRAMPSIDIVPPHYEEGDLPRFDEHEMMTSTPPRARKGSAESTATTRAHERPARSRRPSVSAPKGTCPHAVPPVSTMPALPRASGGPKPTPASYVAHEQHATRSLTPQTPVRRESWASMSSSTTSPSSVSFDPALVDQFPSVPQSMPEAQREPAPPLVTLGLL